MADLTNGAVTVDLKGRIDSRNAADAEAHIQSVLDGKTGVPVVLDMEELEYISSAGLRVLLRLKKTNPDLRIINVNSDVYEILDMTGFTQMMKVEKAYRVVSVEGCEEVGRGANGTIYRIDQDNVIKVYNNADALADIQHEREVARLALVLGIPTAISYDVVRVNDSYGSVFEFLNARSFSKILETEPEKMDWCVEEYIGMLKKIHSTLVPEGKLPDMKETALNWVRFMKDYLPEDAGEKLIRLVEEVPHDDHMIHGDYHTKNVMLQNDETLLIDMDTLAVGHPIFELASMYNSFIGYSEYDNTAIERFQGFTLDIGKQFWHKALAAYLGTQNEYRIREVEDKARIIGYARMIRRSIRRKGMETPEGRAEIELWKGELLELLEKTDTLLFARNELEIGADVENLQEVLDFIDRNLEDTDCPPRARMQIAVAAEEIFVNIANYAYAPEHGNATVLMEVSEAPVTVTITFMDQGVPYDPLASEEPDVTLSAEERRIGGLGIFLAKKTMDDIVYEYKDGRNILKLKKNL
ncbi:MAG: anti-sigma factor antagonist [Clostridia bacterium]|nr:anti-sigma factor antagonist [Clostridia bacterium]MBR3196801.1 anti-sigma factor antagonist [Clostridia bacterium]